jgi:hypothetical protein
MRYAPLSAKSASACQRYPQVGQDIRAGVEVILYSAIATTPRPALKARVRSGIGSWRKNLRRIPWRNAH